MSQSSVRKLGKNRSHAEFCSSVDLPSSQNQFLYTYSSKKSSLALKAAHSLRRCLVGRTGTEKSQHRPQERSRFFLVNLLGSPGVENNNEEWEGSSATPSDLADELFTGFEDGARYSASRYRVYIVYMLNGWHFSNTKAIFPYQLI